MRATDFEPWIRQGEFVSAEWRADSSMLASNTTKGTIIIEFLINISSKIFSLKISSESQKFGLLLLEILDLEN